jgi:hypothetical protein
MGQQVVDDVRLLPGALLGELPRAVQWSGVVLADEFGVGGVDGGESLLEPPSQVVVEEPGEGVDTAAVFPDFPLPGSDPRFRQCLPLFQPPRPFVGRGW